MKKSIMFLLVAVMVLVALMACSKTEVFYDGEAELEAWLGGTYTRPDGAVPADLTVGRLLYTYNDDESNYWVKTVPVTSMDNLATAAGRAYDGTIYELEVDLSGY